MKKGLPILLMAMLLWAGLNAQTRYLDEVFTTVDNDSTDILYGMNIGIISGYPVPTGFVLTDAGMAGMPGDTSLVGNVVYQEPALVMDVYEPSGDTVAERPLIIHMHTGTFLPIVHNTNPTGMKDDFASKQFCEAYAKRGYVVANIDYRLGWNPYLTTQSERAASLMTAVYRAIQDCKAAVRYMRLTAMYGNPYRIDTSRIILSGQGSGGWVALGYASIDKLEEIQLPKFLLLDSNNVAYPAIDTAIQGDWDGYGGLTPFTAPVGYPIMNIENHKGVSDDIDMVLSMGGGMGDLSWLEAGDVPMAAVHCPTDPTAIFTTGDVSVALIGLVTTDISGSHDVMKKANDLGNNDVLTNAGYNDPYTLAAWDASQDLIGFVDQGGTTITESVENLFPLMTANASESSPWDYWDSTMLADVIAPAVGLQTNDGTNAHINGIGTNPDMSYTKAVTYIDSVMGYFAPRLVNGLGLPGNTVGIAKDDFDTKIKIMPNPTTDFCIIELGQGEKANIKLFNISGQLIEDLGEINSKQVLNLKSLRSGAYILEATGESYKESFKILKN
jgi:hypothetical protein